MFLNFYSINLLRYRSNKKLNMSNQRIILELNSLKIRTVLRWVIKSSLVQTSIDISKKFTVIIIITMN